MKPIVRSGLLWIVILHGSVFSQNPTPSVNLPLNHFAHDFLERMEVTGILPPSIELRNKPFSRNDVLKCILLLEERIHANPGLFSSTDLSLFRKLKGEFHLELKNAKVLFPEEEKEKHLFSWGTSDQSSYVVGDAVIEQAFQLDRLNHSSDSSGENVSFSRAAGRVRGIVKNGIAFYSDFSSTLIKGSDRSYRFGENSQGGVINYNAVSSNVYSLNSNAYIVIEPRWFRLQFGKDPISLGPGKHSNLFLSDNAPAFDNLRLDVTYDRIKFTYLHGWLRSDPYRYSAAPDTSVQKFIVVHRLEFKVLPWLFIAGNESVIYGGRDVEIAYLNPIIPYHVTEQYLGDRDNNTISFDFTAFPWKNWKFFGAVYLDDFTNTQNPFTYWKQTWAVLGGFFWTNPGGLANTDFRAEYSRVEPYVYAHKFDLINYSHFGTGLGSFMQPNSDDYFFEIRYRPIRRIDVALNYELTRHGRGDIYTFGYEDGFVDEGPGVTGKTKKTFLMGTQETKNKIGVDIQWEPINNHSAYLSGSLTDVTNLNNELGRDIKLLRILIGYRLDY